MKKRIILTGIVAAASLCFAISAFAEAGPASETVTAAEAGAASEAVTASEAEPAAETVTASEAGAASEAVTASEAEPASETVTVSEAGAASEKEPASEAEPAAEAESEKESEMTRIDKDFYITGITDEIFDRMKGKSFKDDCTVPREDLRYLHVLHKNIDGDVLEGEMVVNKYIAEDVLEILKELYEADYPIERMVLIDEYDADDEASMEDNNSSSFNFRLISHTNRVSKHGLGMAVDINTLYNPYTKVVDGERIIEPITGEPYLDRDASFPYKIEKGDLCYKLFTEHGFVWGGDWTNRKDYQHFEIPESVIEKLY